MSGDEVIRSRRALRKKKIRRRKIIFRSVLGFIFLVAGIIFALMMFFNINEIKVSGDAAYSEGDIINASEINEGDNLIFISKTKVNDRISSKLPYVGSVTVKRRLPTGLELVVHKTEAKYAIVSNGYYTLLDGTGKVLEKDLEYIGENIIIVGVGEVAKAEAGYPLETENSHLIEKLVEVRKAMEKCGLGEITSIDLSDIYDIKLTYQGRITLELGDTNKDRLEKKLSLGKAAIEKQNEESEYSRGTINLTVDGKGYWAEETSATEPQTEPVTDENVSGTEPVTENTAPETPLEQ